MKPVSLDISESDTLPRGIIWLVWLVPPLGVAGLWGWVRYRQWHQRSKAHTSAFRQAQHQLQDAQEAPIPDSFRLARKAIVDYLHNRASYQFGSAETDLSRLMAEVRVPQALSQAVLICLEKADEASYAPNAVLDQKTLIQQASKILLDLEEGWK